MLEVNFLKSLIEEFLEILDLEVFSNKQCDSEDDKHDDSYGSKRVNDACVLYCERFMEFLIDLLSQLPTRRYYYAVVVCDSIVTANIIYKTCDGVELERSSNVLDLRFIPDTMQLKHPPRDVATEVYGASWLVIGGMFLVLKAVSLARRRFIHNNQAVFRLIWALFFLICIGIVFLFYTPRDIVISVLAFTPIGWGLLLIAQACKPVVQWAGFWESVGMTCAWVGSSSFQLQLSPGYHLFLKYRPACYYSKGVK